MESLHKDAASDYPPALDPKKHLTEITGLSASSVYNLLMKMPNFPKVKCGRRYIVPRDAFFRWFEQQMANDEE